jgi:cytochrome c
MKNFFPFASLLFCLISLSSLTSCGNEPAKTAPKPLADNELSEQDKAEGWKLLFDGKTLDGWHKYGGAPVGKVWQISDGAIHLNAAKEKNDFQSANGGDIVTNGAYENFELRLEWKIDSCGNSGIIYHIVEDSTKYNHAWKTGPEMQVLDNACHSDASIQKHRAGDLYDLVECSTVTVKPHGEWNAVRIVSRGGKVEHWLNGTKVLEIQLFEGGKPSQQWLDLIAVSKFPKEPAPDFGLSPKGKIALQDHGDKVWYKNIKIKTF